MFAFSSSQIPTYEPDSSSNFDSNEIVNDENSESFQDINTDFGMSVNNDEPDAAPGYHLPSESAPTYNNIVSSHGAYATSILQTDRVSTQSNSERDEELIEPLRFSPVITPERVARITRLFFPRQSGDPKENMNYISEFFEKIQIFTVQDLIDSIFDVTQIHLRYIKAQIMLGISDEVIDMHWECIRLQNELKWRILNEKDWTVVNELISDFEYFINRSHSTFLMLELDIEIPLDLSKFGKGIFAPQRQNRRRIEDFNFDSEEESDFSASEDDIGN